MVEMKLLVARSIWVRAVSDDHADGRVPDRALDRRLREARLDKVDQEVGRDAEGKMGKVRVAKDEIRVFKTSCCSPLMELPSKLRYVREVIHWRFSGKGPERLM